MSLIVDGAGVPVPFHHGTSQAFHSFDTAFVGTGMSDADEPEVGFFFTPDRDFALRYAHGHQAAIITAHLDISDAYRITGAMWGRGEGLSPEEARLAGHDAYIVSPYDEGDMWIVFDVASITAITRESIVETTVDKILDECD